MKRGLGLLVAVVLHGHLRFGVFGTHDTQLEGKRRGNFTRAFDAGSAGAKSGSMVRIRLTRRSVRTQPSNRQTLLAGPLGLIRRQPREEDGARSYFVGVVSLGDPAQRFRVAFDSASGQVLLPASACQSAACMEHRRYEPEASSTAVDLNADGSLMVQAFAEPGHTVHRDAISVGLSSMDVGDGQATGDLIKERICLGEKGRKVCSPTGMVAVFDLTEVPFRSMPHDGIVGLSLKSLSIGPAFNFLSQFSKHARLPPKFGLFLGERSGELTLGDFNPLRFSSPISWVPVIRLEEGYWQFRFKSVRFGNRSIAACASGECRGIVDTCASAVGVPSVLLGETVQGWAGARAAADCGISLELQNGDFLTLDGRMEGRFPFGADACVPPKVSPVDLPESFSGAFILGEPLLRRYYMAFDAGDAPRVGFSPATAMLLEPMPEAEEAELAADVEADLWKQAGVFSPQAAATGSRSGLSSVLLQALSVQLLLAFWLAPWVIMLACSGESRSVMSYLAGRFGGALAHAGLVPVMKGAVSRLSLEEVKASGDECAICLGCCEEDTQGSSKHAHLHWCRLRCGHQFHEQCIFEWLWKAPRCPVCRAHLLESAAQRPGDALPASRNAAEGRGAMLGVYLA